ncbi:MAG TPA: ACT domain-containing protein [Candidatus Limnocylindrales bacterium]|jgi:hypothetical protein|nr:ACT domain-containing protein [Candidatus Limnocylindrales bacterium]
MPTDLTVPLADRPGTLADAAEALGRAGINIEGGCGVASGGQGVFHVLVNDAEAARSALSQSGIQVGEARDVLVVDVANEPGALGRVARRIADAGVNLEAVYATVDNRIVFVGPDIARARETTSGS